MRIVKGTAKNYEAITVSTTAIGFTRSALASGGSKCTEIFLTVEDANIRYRVDGTAPTTTEGHLLTNGQNLILQNLADIDNFKAIRDGAADAKLRVTYRF